MSAASQAPLDHGYWPTLQWGDFRFSLCFESTFPSEVSSEGRSAWSASFLMTRRAFEQNPSELNPDHFLCRSPRSSYILLIVNRRHP